MTLVVEVAKWLSLLNGLQHILHAILFWIDDGVGLLSRIGDPGEPRIERTTTMADEEVGRIDTQAEPPSVLPGGRAQRLDTPPPRNAAGPVLQDWTLASESQIPPATTGGGAGNASSATGAGASSVMPKLKRTRSEPLPSLGASMIAERLRLEQLLEEAQSTLAAFEAAGLHNHYRDNVSKDIRDYEDRLLAMKNNSKKNPSE